MSGNRLNVYIVLQPARIREEVVVSATRSRTAAPPGAASVLDADDLKSRQTLRLTDMLSELPGVSVATTGGVGAQSSLFMRGG